MVFVTFFGEPKLRPEKIPGLRMAVPLVVLAFFSLFGGFLETPETLGHITVFSDFLNTAVPSLDLPAPAHATELLFQGLSAAASLGGLALAYLLYLRRRDLLEKWLDVGLFGALRTFWSQGWGFDRLYAFLFVRPYVAAARWARDDRVDRPFAGIARLAEYSNHALRRTQTGRVRTYLAGIALGAVLILAVGALL
jgi:NADH-quinone oxidoreductase subunit L